MSIRQAARVFGLHRETVSKMLRYSVPPGYRRSHPPRRPKLDPFVGIIHRILEEDRLSPHKQRHTARRIFERVRQEYGFAGGYTIVKDYVREHRRWGREVFDPLHYLSLIERKIGALDQAAPLKDWVLPEAFATLRRLLEARMGKSGKRGYVQVVRLLETFEAEDALLHPRGASGRVRAAALRGRAWAS